MAWLTKHEAYQQRSLAAFLEKKAEFDTLLAGLQHASADHFGADHDGTGAAESGQRGPTRASRCVPDSPLRLVTVVRILPGTARGDYRPTEMRECAAKAGDIGRPHIGRI
jgi:hypothetical protein